MKKRYIICFDSLNDEESKKIITILREHGLAWWHWIEDVWFVVDKQGKYSANEIRDKVMTVANQRMIVVELNEERDTWAGVRANDPDEKMFKWFKESWNKNK